jgi:hypothetical protein
MKIADLRIENFRGIRTGQGPRTEGHICGLRALLAFLMGAWAPGGSRSIQQFRGRGSKFVRVTCSPIFIRRELESVRSLSL